MVAEVGEGVIIRLLLVAEGGVGIDYLVLYFLFPFRFLAGVCIPRSPTPGCLAWEFSIFNVNVCRITALRTEQRIWFGASTIMGVSSLFNICSKLV